MPPISLGTVFRLNLEKEKSITKTCVCYFLLLCIAIAKWVAQSWCARKGGKQSRVYVYDAHSNWHVISITTFIYRPCSCVWGNKINFDFESCYDCIRCDGWIKSIEAINAYYYSYKMTDINSHSLPLSIRVMQPINVISIMVQSACITNKCCS